MSHPFVSAARQFGSPVSHTRLHAPLRTDANVPPPPCRFKRAVISSLASEGFIPPPPRPPSRLQAADRPVRGESIP